jgi:NADH-quinone oxidoreductase subunit L
VLSLAGIGLAFLFYIRRRGLTGQLQRRFAVVHRFLENKWYFDELFDRAFVRPAAGTGRFFRGVVETEFVQGTIVGGSTALVRAGSSFARTLQSGYVRAYALGLLVGVAGLALYFLIASS